MRRKVPAVDGWFTTGDKPRLLGLRCPECGTYVFPPRAIACPNPDCPRPGTQATELETVELSHTGTVWSYTVNHYAPPAPYVSPDPFVPYGVAAVELAEEKMVVLGQVVGDPSALAVGAKAELVIDTLFEDDESEHVVWKWKLS